MALLTYVFAAGVTGGSVNPGDGSTFNLAAAMAAGGGQITVDTVAQPLLANALARSNAVILQGTSSSPAVVTYGLQPINAYAGPAATGDHLVRGSDGQFAPKQLALRGMFSLQRTYGHSIAAGGGASSFDSNGSTVVGSFFGVSDVLNLGIGGSYLGRDSADGQNGGVSWISQREARSVKKAPYVAGLDLCHMHYGYEDILLGQTSTAGTPVAQNLPIFLNALRAALAIVRSSARFYAGDKTGNLDPSIVLATPANWTASANPATPAGARIPARFAGHPVGIIGTAVNGAGGAFSITIPGDYPGSAVCPFTIILWVGGALGLTTGTLTASGASTGTFNLVQLVAGGTPANTPGTYDRVNSKGNLIAWRFANANPGQAGYIAPSNGVPQTLTLTPASLNNGGFALADYLIEAQNPPIIAFPFPVDGAYGNPNIFSFQGIRNSDVALFNAGAQNLFNTEFGDGTDVTAGYSLGGSGNVLGLGGTQGNAAAATVISATGFGGTTGVNCQVSSVADPLAAPSTVVNGVPTWALAIASQSVIFGTSIEYEIVTFTGRTGTSPTWTLTGITRGAYNTPALAHSGNPICDLLNIGAIAAHSSDLIHPSDSGHATVAGAIITAIQGLSLDPVATPRRVRARSSIFAIYQTSWVEQIIAVQGGGPAVFTALNWDQCVVDSANMMFSLGNILSSTFNALTVPARGRYDCRFCGMVTAGRATSAGSTAGIASGVFAVGLFKNGVEKYRKVQTYNAADFPNAFFAWALDASFPLLELDVGDTVALRAYQSGAGASTTITDNPLTIGATTINLAATAGMVAGDVLRAENEEILIGTVASGTQLTGCTRGYAGTTAAQHSSGVAAFTGRGLYGAGNAGSLPAQFTIERRAAG